MAGWIDREWLVFVLPFRQLASPFGQFMEVNHDSIFPTQFS